MRWKQITEAPLTDFDTFGDAHEPGSFRDEDLMAMRNPKWRAKVFRAFANTPYRFNIYLYNGPDGMLRIGHAGETLKVNDIGNQSQYVGVVPLSRVERLIGKMPPSAASSINILLVENEGDARLPMTPWILAHRVAHAFIESNARETRTNAMESAIENIVSIFIEFILFAANTITKSLDLPYVPWSDPQGMINEVAKVFGKVRSMRQGNLANRGEFVVEAIAQYLVQGAVSFNRPVLDAADIFDQKVSSFEDRINTAIKALVDLYIGKALIL